MGFSTVKVGSLDVSCMVTSRFRLDGGSMFRVVPRVLWEKKAQADEKNRIQLNLNSLVIKAGDLYMLVDTGMGTKYDERERAIYALDERDAEDAISHIGLSVDDIDIIMLTHLHFDHAGGSTKLTRAGDAVSVFKKARFVIQEEEWRAAIDPHPLDKGSYSAPDFMPLLKSDQVELVAGNKEIVPGISVELTGGHTPGHQVVRIYSEGSEALYLGDLVPTTAHLRLNWLTAWDLEPEVVFAEKERILDDAARNGSLLFLSHDPEVAACKIRKDSPLKYSPIRETIITTKV